jgi:hypothetical protein
MKTMQAFNGSKNAYIVYRDLPNEASKLIDAAGIDAYDSGFGKLKNEQNEVFTITIKY